MLKPAQLYKDELEKENIKAWYKPENIYWDGGTGDSTIGLPDNNYNSHCFVSVDKDDNIIGYIAYVVDWAAMSADRFGIISYRKNSIEFARDVYKVICDLFEVYHMNRVSWCAFADNPAVRGYRNFIRKHGGRECGYHRQAARLQDGKLHDSVEFEILAEEFCKKQKTVSEQQGTVLKQPESLSEQSESLSEQPETEPKTEKPKRSYRKRIDTGKIMALKNAGWSVKEIAAEMRVHPQSIYNAIYQYKKKYGDSEP